MEMVALAVLAGLLAAAGVTLIRTGLSLSRFYKTSYGQQFRQRMKNVTMLEVLLGTIPYDPTDDETGFIRHTGMLYSRKHSGLIMTGQISDEVLDRMKGG